MRLGLPLVHCGLPFENVFTFSTSRLRLLLFNHCRMPFADAFVVCRLHLMVAGVFALFVCVYRLVVHLPITVFWCICACRLLFAVWWCICRLPFSGVFALVVCCLPFGGAFADYRFLVHLRLSFVVCRLVVHVRLPFASFVV